MRNPESSEAPSEKVLRGSPDRFGYSWAAYSEIDPESKLQLERWLGDTGLASFEGKSVLDVGSGMGRNPYWMARAGARSVTAVDVDDRSLDAARNNLRALDNARVLKRSVYELDSTELGQFDRVTCIGVLHHLSEPGEALTKMWGCVAKGGDLVLWCYAKEGNTLLLPIIQAFRGLGSRLPIEASHVVAKSVAALAWPGIKLIPWQTEYYRNLKKLPFKIVEGIIFDQMLPKISNYWTREQLAALLAPLGGEVFIQFVQGNSWHIRVRKMK